MKVCNKCGILKDDTCYYKTKFVCKKCYSDKSKIISHSTIKEKSFNKICEFCNSNGGKCLESKYLGCSKKHKVICKNNHIFYVYLNGATWCQVCKKEDNQKEKTKKVNEYCESKGGECLEYDSDINKYKTLCKNGHVFYLIWKHSKHYGCWCPKCHFDSDKEMDVIHKKCSELGGKCLENTYKGIKETYKCQCKNGHLFMMYWDYTKVNNSWCPHCLQDNKGEFFCRKIFEEKFSKPFPRIKPKWLKNPKTGYRLELDGFNEELKIAFEYDGIQHYEFPNYFHKDKKSFDSQIERDVFKDDLCKQNDVLLIRIKSVDCRNQEKAKKIILKQITNIY